MTGANKPIISTYRKGNLREDEHLSIKNIGTTLVQRQPHTCQRSTDHRGAPHPIQEGAIHQKPITYPLIIHSPCIISTHLIQSIRDIYIIRYINNPYCPCVAHGGIVQCILPEVGGPLNVHFIHQFTPTRHMFTYVLKVIPRKQKKKIKIYIHTKENSYKLHYFSHPIFYLILQ